jgi:hypothetical protein
MFRLVFMFILFLPFGVYADITPKFSYEKSASCIASDGGIIVKLKDETTSSVAIIERIWNRGDGNPNIAGNNPVGARQNTYQSFIGNFLESENIAALTI